MLVIHEDPGYSVATPLCESSIRGPETSIHVVASRLGASIGEKAGQIGKAIKRRYTERYGAAAAAALPKRTTYFRGKPFAENCYYARDEDIISAAIREVLAHAPAS